MKKFYYLDTCSTCKRILKELNPGEDVQLREIKSAPLTPREVDELAGKAGSYEAIFSKRARKYRELNLNEKTLIESDFRHYLLEDYTFLKRPVLVTNHKAIAGNSAKATAEMQKLI